MSNLSILVNQLLEEFHNEYEKSDSLDTSFEVYSNYIVFKNIQLSLEEIEEGVVGSGQDGGIDGFFLFINDVLISNKDQLDELKKEDYKKNNIKIDLHLIQSKNSTRIQESVIEKFISKANYIFSNLKITDAKLEEVFNIDLTSKIKLFHKAILKFNTLFPVLSIKYYQICKGDKTNIYGPPANLAFTNLIENLKETVKREYGSDINVSYELIDAKKIIDLSRQSKDFTLALNINKNFSVQYNNGGNSTGYIVTAKIKDYFKFLTDEDKKLKTYLFDSNVRDYLNYNTEVNKEISTTVREHFQYDFWWLNNGITVIASKGQISGDLITLDNVQIVNGLQTSHTIYNELYDKDVVDDDRSILIKIIITEDKDTIDNIIRSTNFQNRIEPASLKATEDTQKNIEDYFSGKDLYYERRKNYYRNQGKPLNKIVSIYFLAQSIAAIILKDPSGAKQSPTSKIKKEYDQIFKEGRSLEVYYKTIMLIKKVEAYLKSEFNPGNAIEKAIGSYFSLHLARVLASIMLNSSGYGDSQFEKLNLDELNEDYFKSAINVLSSLISKYEEGNDRFEGYLYLAKTVGFSKFITENITEELI